MNQMDELKLFVSKRLQAAASEILGAIEKTITGYEQQASRLKEENDRNCSLLDIIIKSNLAQTPAKTLSNQHPPPPPAPATPTAVSPCQPDSRLQVKEREALFRTPSDLQCVFTSRDDFFKNAAKGNNGNCPYCLKRMQANETHLRKRHYSHAVHFIEGGVKKFVVPCMCKEIVQGRSHWHCPYCHKILYRKCYFEAHLLKLHGYSIQQHSHDAEANQPPVSASEEEVPPSPERPSLLLQVKEEAEQVSCAEAQCSEQLHIKDEVMQKCSDHMREQSQEPSLPLDSMFVIGDVSESSKGYSLFTPSTQAMEPQRNCGVSGILAPAWETLHSTGSSLVTEDGSCSATEESRETQTLYSRSSVLSAKRKRCVKRFSPHMTLNKKRARQITNQDSALSYSCKACGKIFHYMYTLRTHVQTHTKDKSRVCGICGKHLHSAESLVQHLQSHTKSNKCGTCGKQFSSNSRLKQHRMFHRPKGVNVMSSA